MAPTRPDRPTVAERQAVGRAARKQVPRSSHAAWSAPADRRDPVALLGEQDADRLPFLVPVRHGRMAVSPFTFYRGAARIMAADLATTAVSGLTAQICGDAHLANFGGYASPERQLVFDLNDFDETLPGPWEWDVKRMAASFLIAGRHRGFDEAANRAVTTLSVASYRQAMIDFAGKGALDIWYAHLTGDDLLVLASELGGKKAARSIERIETKARSKDNLQAQQRLAVEVDGQYQIRNDPPVLLRLTDTAQLQATGADHPDDIEGVVRHALETYADTLADDRRAIFDRYRRVDIAIKVVGVGSVGTRCLIVLLEGRDRNDPLFLQVKEAGGSVLEEFLPASRYPNHGQRVVEGQRLMQAASDIFLGWTHGRGGRDFYVRQLRDWKSSVDLEKVSAAQLQNYARVCGWTLARAHARSGDPIAIASYLGTKDIFDQALTEFSVAYAAQNDADFQAFLAAIEAGRIQTAPG
jgi:uncharacterized protein (DUF2252 family)